MSTLFGHIVRQASVASCCCSKLYLPILTIHLYQCLPVKKCSYQVKIITIAKNNNSRSNCYNKHFQQIFKEIYIWQCQLNGTSTCEWKWFDSNLLIKI